MFKTIFIVIVSLFLGCVALVILTGIYHLIQYIFVGRKRNKLRQINREKAKAEFEKKREQEKAVYMQYKYALSQKYGEPDKIISYGEGNHEIIVFAKASIVVIRGKEYSFDDIISCSLIDNSRVKRGDTSTTIETRTDSGSLIGRSAAGGLIAGPIGAVIGASSAAKTSSATSINEYDVIEHSYSLIIGIRSFEQPTIDIYLGKKRSIAFEMDAIFNIILSENRSKQQGN